MRYSPIISSINTWGIENFKKEGIRDFIKQKRGPVFHNETYSLQVVREALSKTYKKNFLGTLKIGTKLVGAGMLMGAGAEIAGDISSKAQG